MNIYLLILSGQGDLEIKVVDKETYEWVTSSDLGRPQGYVNKYSWEDQLVPASQIAKRKEDQGEDYYPVSLSFGSWDNDRAIAAMPIDGYAHHYSSVLALIEQINHRGDYIADEYVGCIY